MKSHLCHGEEEGAEDRDGHHQVKVDEKVGAELREALRWEGVRRCEKVEKV